MGARVKTVAFQGIEAVPVDVQAQFTTGAPPTVTIVGLPDKAIREAGERVRAALLSSGLSLPPRRIVVKKPVARCFSAASSPAIHFSTSALVVPGG